MMLFLGFILENSEEYREKRLANLDKGKRIKCKLNYYHLHSVLEWLVGHVGGLKQLWPEIPE